MRKTVLVMMIFSVALIVFIAGPVVVSAQDNNPIELTMSASSPKAGRFKCGFKPWAERIEQATGGKVKISFSFGVNPGDPYERILKGASTDIVFFPYGNTKPKHFPLTKVSFLPGVSIGIKDPVMASDIFWNLYKKFPEIQNEHKDLKVLFTFAMAPSYLATTTKPVHALTDMRGMKIAAGGSQSGLMKELGVVMKSLRPATTSGARMEKGEMEGAIFGLMGQRAFGVTKVANYFTEWHGGPFFIICMNKNKWNQLSKDIQSAIMSVSGDAGSKFISECDHKSNQKALNGVRAAGKEVISLSPEDNTRLSEMCDPICNNQIAALEAKGLPAGAVFKEIRQMVADYR